MFDSMRINTPSNIICSSFLFLHTATFLHEVSVDLLTHDECGTKASSIKFFNEREICASKKQFRKTMKYVAEQASNLTGDFTFEVRNFHILSPFDFF